MHSRTSRLAILLAFGATLLLGSFAFAQPVQQIRGVDSQVDYQKLNRLGPWDDRNYRLTARDLRILAPNEAELRVQVPAFFRVEMRRANPDMQRTGPAQYPRSALQIFRQMYGGYLVEGKLYRKAEFRDGTWKVLLNGGVDKEVFQEMGPEAFLSGEVRITNPNGAAESAIKINPVNTDLVVAGSNGPGSGQIMHYSNDGGTTWNTSAGLPGGGTCCDPTVDWSSDGSLAYTATLGNCGGGGCQIWFYRSSDNGQTWNDLSGSPARRTLNTGGGNDKEFIHVDKFATSPHKDNIYATWHASNVMQFSRSTDLGNTWSTQAFSSASDQLGIGSDITTDKNGDVYYVWPAFNSQRILLRKSTDGGATFGSVIEIAPTEASFTFPVPSMETRDVFVYASVDADLSNGPYGGSVYAAWTDSTGATGSASNNHARIQVAYSRNGGSTWSVTTPHETADQNSVDRYHQWLAVGADGKVHVIFYDTRRSASRTAVDVFYSFSDDGAQTWSTPSRITAELSPNIGDSFEFGDYNGLDIVMNDLIAIYTDNRNESGGSSDSVDVYAAGIPVSGGGGNTAPSVNITAPADGSSVDVGNSVSFSGTATDAEDGDLSASLAWTSSIDGSIGSGASFSTSSLSLGSHTITATATDSGGLGGSDSITLNITDPNSNGPQNAVYSAGLGAPACAIAGSSCDSQTLLDGRAGLGPESNQPNTLDSCTDGTTGTYQSDESNDRVVVSTLDNSDFVEGATVQLDVTVWAWNDGSADSLDLYYAADANSPSWVFIATLNPTAGGAQTLSTTYTLPTGTLQAVRANFRYQGSPSPCSGGNYDDADDLVFAVNPAGGGGNTAPSATITSPADGASFVAGTSVSFAGSANDAEDGNLTGSLSWTSSLDGNLGSGGSFSTSGLSVGSHTITASVTDSGGLSGSDSVAITVTPASGGCTDCVDWNTTTTVSYSNQDSSANFTIEDGGDTLLLEDNTWRRTSQTFNITANTVIEVEFSSAVQGEIHGIGFDENDTLTDAVRIFQLHGTQTWTSANQDFNNYAGGGGFVTYTIPVGQYYTGSAMFLVLVNDNDAGSGNDSRFRNVRIYEDTPPAGCAADVDFSAGASGWTNSGSCTTGAFVAGTPTEIVNGGVTTQLAGDHTTGSGNAWFTAPNSGAGTDDVDGGTCITTSPVYTVTEASDVSAWYFHGQRDAGDDAGDFFTLELSINGGSTWTTLASFGDVTVNAAWTEATTTVAAGTSVQFRVQVADGTAGGDLVEAGIDDVSICPTP